MSATLETDEIGMRIILKPEAIRGAHKGDSHAEPSPQFIAWLMDATGLPFEALFEIVREPQSVS